MSNKRFFMNGDEWGLCRILPAENLAHCKRVIDEHHSHHKDTEFSLNGWATPPLIIPEPQQPISSRGITLSNMESLFADVMPRADGVDSCEDFTGDPFRCPNCFAFALSLDDYWHSQGLYGHEKNAVIQSLYAEGFSVSGSRRGALIAALGKFGLRYDLILFAYSNEIVDLRVPDQIESYVEIESDSDEE